MDTSALRRSTLQRKDRDELVAIAAALDVKAPSKARKAEIVDLILGAVGSDGEGGDADAADSPAKDDAPTAKKAKADDADSGDTDSGDTDSANTESGDTESGDTAEKSEDERPAPRARGRQNQNAKGSQDRSRQDRSGADKKGAEQASGGTEKSGSEKGGGDQGNRDDDGRGRNRNRDDQTEPGNRRRRRRGRGDQQRDEPVDPWDGTPIPVDGFLDVREEGYGFLRVDGWMPSPEDAYVSLKMVRSLGLRKGDHLVGTGRPANRNERNPAVIDIESINGQDPETAAKRPNFDDLTPLFPDVKLQQENPRNENNLTGRIIDLLAPIGKGQRGLIVAPPKAGKTNVLKSIARSIEINDPDVELIVLLVDERPEEVTDMKRWLKTGSVASSTFDRPSDEHMLVAEMTLERAKRSVEAGKDVVILLDGITRLARAYNLAAPASGRVLSGGVDAAALYPPKKFFGAARNLEEGGSLTILATALVETGSKMDDVIFEEFKGTGNMELRLSRSFAEQRIYPAIDVLGSSTRHEELLFTPKALDQAWKLRRVLGAIDGGPAAGLEMLIDRLGSFKTNEAFLKEMK